jgi:cell division protein FtsL
LSLKLNQKGDLTMLAAVILILSILVLVSFLAIGIIVGYLVRQYFEENKPVYTSHPELWDKETGKLIVDSDILAIRVDSDFEFLPDEDGDDD